MDLVKETIRIVCAGVCLNRIWGCMARLDRGCAGAHSYNFAHFFSNCCGGFLPVYPSGLVVYIIPIQLV